MKHYGYIYSLTLVDGRTYVGQTTRDPYDYFKVSYVKEEGRGRSKLARAIQKYGIESFQFDVIDYAKTKDELDKKECYWINAYCCLEKDKGFNLRDGGSHGKLSADVKYRIGQSVSKVCKGEDNSFFGKKHSEKTRELMKNAQTGEKNHFFGKKHSVESKLKRCKPSISLDGSLFFLSQSEANKKGFFNVYRVVRGLDDNSKGIVFRYATPEEIFKHTGVMV